MAATPVSSAELIDLVRKSGLADDSLDGWLRNNPSLPRQVNKTAAKLVADGVITPFHAKHMLSGRYKGFVLGGYRVLDEIGRGGMGAIFLAEHMTMRRRVAIKVLPADKAGDEESRARFYREARVVAALDHPNVVHAYDIGRQGDTHFMVMEYIQGESLEDMLRRKGPLPARDAADYIAQAARGLQHAHERGLIHRDIKPGNLIVDTQGVLKVLDMGLARFFEENSSLTTEMCSGSVIGTADYMAPEQSVNSHEVDIRADIYSLGITLYALLTGRPPFADATVAQKLLAHHMRQPEPIQLSRPDVSDELVEIAMKMMAKAPADRYQTPGEVAAALDDWLRNQELSSALTAKMENTVVQRYVARNQSPGRKKWRIYAIGGGAGVVFVAVVAGLIIASQPKPKPENGVSVIDEPVISTREYRTHATNTTGRPNSTSTLKTSAAAVQVQAPVGQTAPPSPPETPKPAGPLYGAQVEYVTGSKQLQRLALSPDDTLLAGGSVEGDVKVFEFATGALRADLSEAHMGVVRFVNFSPNGQLLLSAGSDGFIKVWNTKTWKLERCFGEPEAGLVKSAVFSPDGTRIFSGHTDGFGRFWDVQKGELIRTCSKRHEGDRSRSESLITYVCWAPNGKLAYSAGRDGAVRAWDAATGNEVFAFREEGEGTFSTVMVTPDSSKLVVGASKLRTVNAVTGTKIRDFGPEGSDGLSGVISGDGTIVAMASVNGVKLWDIETGTLFYKVENFTASGSGVAITRDCKRFAGSLKDGTMYMWNSPAR